MNKKWFGSLSCIYLWFPFSEMCGEERLGHYRFPGDGCSRRKAPFPGQPEQSALIRRSTQGHFSAVNQQPLCPDVNRQTGCCGCYWFSSSHRTNVWQQANHRAAADLSPGSFPIRGNGRHRLSAAASTGAEQLRLFSTASSGSVHFHASVSRNYGWLPETVGTRERTVQMLRSNLWGRLFNKRLHQSKSSRGE